MGQFLALPQGEIGLIFFQFITKTLPIAADGVFDTAAAQFTVIVIDSHPKIDIAFGFVGIAFVDQIADHGGDLVDSLRDARGDSRRQDVEVGHVLLEAVDIVFGQLQGILAAARGPVDDLVIDIGKVHHMANFVAAEHQITPDHVEDDG